MKTRWQTKKLGDVCSLLNRGISPAYLEEGGVCVLNQKCVRDHEVSYEPSRRHDSKAKKVAEERFIQLGDVLVNSTGTGTLGRVAQVRDEPEEATTVDSHVSIVRPKPGLFHLDFFGYMLVVIEDAIKEAGEGCGGQTELARSVLAERFSVSYPESLAEQQRIVGLLDEAFEGLATAKANAEKNLQNARALFESHLQSVFTQRGLGWVDRTLNQVCIVERGSSPRPIKEYFTTEPDGVNWIKIGDTEEGGKYVYSTSQKITLKGAEQSRFVKEGDFILTNSMSYGRPYIMKTSGCIHDGWFVLRLNMAIDKDFFYYLLSSPVVQLQFAALASGSVVKNISGDLVKKAVLPIPPLEHQYLIVKKLLALEEETQRLARLYERKCAALEALKKSLLHQAFSGEL
jgi:type I restriction enzyme, S subunit